MLLYFGCILAQDFMMKIPTTFVFLSLSFLGIQCQTETCYNKFEYEYNVLQKLLTLEGTQATQQDTITQKQDLIVNLTKELEDATNKIKFQWKILNQIRESDISGASTYIRWGRTVCPDNGTELVYEGFVGGSKYTHQGGAANNLCLPKDPLWSYYEDGTQNKAFIYGAEYEFRTSRMKFFPNAEEDMYNHAAPCAVCRPKHPTTMMLPARNACFDGWTLEYSGYLVAGYYNHASASEYICLDGEPESVPGSYANSNGRLLYFVEGICGSLKCPPYVNGRELTCAVCTK